MDFNRRESESEYWIHLVHWGGSCKYGNERSEFYERRRISYAVERPSAPQEVFCSIDLVDCLKCTVLSKSKIADVTAIWVYAACMYKHLFLFISCF
jgi:hypothetical protein